LCDQSAPAAQAAAFKVPQAGGASLRVDLAPAQPNAFVFRVTDKRYSQILASCLKSLLAGLGR